MQSIPERLKDLTLFGAIRLIREVAAVVVLGYLGIRLFSGDLGLDFGKLSASELVSFLLAFFSIGLSAAFYFAATSQSNQFYDNVNKFSKDTSELLGRLDEQVKGLGGRQSELKDSIDKHYFRDRTAQTDAAKDEVEAQTKEAEENISKIVSDLLDKTNLTPDEKNEFEAKLKTKDAELSALREKLAQFSRPDISSITRYIKLKIIEIMKNEGSDMRIQDLAMKIINASVEEFRRDLLLSGFTTKLNPETSKDLTIDGLLFFQNVRQQIMDRFVSH